MENNSDIEDGNTVQNLNAALEVSVRGLVAEGYLTSSKGEEILQNYGLIVHRKGWFNSFIDIIFGLNEDDSQSGYARFIKLINPADLKEPRSPK